MFVNFDNRMVNLETVATARRQLLGIPGQETAKVTLQPIVGPEISYSGFAAEKIWEVLSAEAITATEPTEPVTPTDAVDELEALTAPTPPPMPAKASS